MSGGSRLAPCSDVENIRLTKDRGLHEVEVEKVRFWQSHYSVKEENEIDPLLSYNVIVSDEEKRVPTKERHRKR